MMTTLATLSKNPILTTSGIIWSASSTCLPVRPSARNDICRPLGQQKRETPGCFQLGDVVDLDRVLRIAAEGHGLKPRMAVGSRRLGCLEPQRLTQRSQLLALH